ncbi:MAG: TonB-dependent receptor [Chitinophagaceae bacterium]|nr:TonB-dependent receptor [Chitinophagaceae bacterium]
MHFKALCKAGHYIRSRIPNQTLLAMKLTVLLIAVGLCANATGFAQKVTLSLRNASLEQVFNEVKLQTGFSFIWDEPTIKAAHPVNIEVREAPVPEVMDYCLRGQSLEYQIIGKLIVIKPRIRTTPPPENILKEIQVPPVDITLSGRVTNNGNEPLEGVSVVVKGTQTGTVTDADGRFQLSVPSVNNVELVFSFVGFQSKTIKVGSQTVFDVVLEQAVAGLDDIVVVGYGTQKKIDLTGSVATVAGADVAQRKTLQVSQALQGAVPGVMVTRNSSAPGTSATIRIRGITTIGNSNPLIIADGVQIGDIDDINPNDIESISVLKDAASASIYGSQASAGVIIVTTKRAKSNRFGIEYNVEGGMEIPTGVPDFVNVTRYMQMLNETRWNDAGNGSNEYPVYSKETIDNYGQLNRENPDKYPNTDWSSLIFKKYAPRTSHVLRIYGGGEKVRTAASIAYDKMGAIYERYTYDRITARVNNDLNINKYLKAFLDINVKSTINQQPYTNLNLLRITRFSPPVYAATWEDGRYAEGKTGDNIYAQVKEGGFKKEQFSQMNARVGLNFDPFDGMNIQAIVAPTLNFTKQKNFRKSIPWYLSDDPTILGGYIQNPTTLWENRNDNNSITYQFTAQYNKTFGSHTVGLLAGYEDYYTHSEVLGASRDNYDLDNYPYLNIGPLELRDNSGSASEYARQSYFGRITYNYKNRYLLQGNVRYDGSSRFAKENRWGVFPSVSAGWVISEEDFMRNSSSVLSLLKFRVSYGTLGNERIGNYPYQATMAFQSALFFQGGNVVSEQGAAQPRYAIRNITWETTESYNVGIDAGFLDNRLNFTGDYYKKNTKDMLLALQIPTYMGFDNPDQNTGKMHTTGWEINIGWRDKIGQVGYKIDFNLSDFKSVMGDLGGTEFLGDQIKVKGSEFNEWYGYRTNGLFQTSDDLSGAALISSSTKPGDVRYVDVSGTDGNPDGRISPEYDRVLLGGSLPRYTYGANISFDYKHFDLGIVIQGVGKQNVRMESDWVQPLMQNWLNITTLVDGNYYSNYNTAKENIEAKYPRLTYSNPGSNYVMSDFWMFNGRYLRIKNISLGYNVPQSLYKNYLQNIRLYASVSDLFCMNKYPQGYDPESGINNYPITTTVVFGASIRF